MIRIMLSIILLSVFTGFVFVYRYVLLGASSALDYILEHFILAAGICLLIIWPLNLSKKIQSSGFSVMFYIVLIFIIWGSVREVVLPKSETISLKHGLIIRTSIGTFSFGVVRKEDKHYVINNTAFFSDNFVVYSPLAEVSQNILSMQQGISFTWSNYTASYPKMLTNILLIPLPFDMGRFYRSWNLDSSRYTPILYLLWDKDILFNPYMVPFRRNWLLMLLGYGVDLVFLTLVGAFGIVCVNKFSWYGIKFIGNVAFYTVLIPAVAILYDYLILLSNVIANIWL